MQLKKILIVLFGLIFLCFQSSATCDIIIDDSTFSTSNPSTAFLLPAVILFVGLWGIGYYTFQTGNPGLGTGMLLLSIPLDIFFAVSFQEKNYLGSGFLGIGFSLMALFTLPLIVLIKRRVAPTKP